MEQVHHQSAAVRWLSTIAISLTVAFLSGGCGNSGPGDCVGDACGAGGSGGQSGTTSQGGQGGDGGTGGGGSGGTGGGGSGGTGGGGSGGTGGGGSGGTGGGGSGGTGGGGNGGTGGGGGTGGTTAECQQPSDCPSVYPGTILGACELWSCGAGGQCEVDPADDGVSCSELGLEGLCVLAACEFECGDGILQSTLGEQCDDGGLTSGDGCRSDCVTEETIGAGFTGGQCEVSADCAPAGSACIPEVGGGSCSVDCTQFCDDQTGAPTTFCIPAADYESRMTGLLPGSLSPALCVSKCDFGLFPSTGCRAGLHCELHQRYNSSVEDEVCVPGPWTIGLALSGDGETVIGVDSDGPAPAEPWARLLDLGCPTLFQPIAAELFSGMALTLMAMDADGRGRNWERLCGAPGNLPDVHGTHAEADAGDAFRLTGTRLEVVDWTAAALYGSTAATGALARGPLYRVRAMVYADGGYYLYTDAADDHPHYDPDRGRHFGMVDGREWMPIDAEVEPLVDYVNIKADGGQRFYKQWGRSSYIQYIGEMARQHQLSHGVPLGIGDFSLPTGGDIAGHGSHELGRDVDLYLLTFDRAGDGTLMLDDPRLWVSSCSNSGGWSCSYYENGTGAGEDFSDPDHVPAADLLTTLAQHAYDNAGPTRFVQHDVEVLAPFRALPGSDPVYIDASNNAASGWPPHENHIHIRFPL